MTDEVRIVTIPRRDPVDAYTMGGIVRDAGLTEQQFGNSCSLILLSHNSLLRREDVTLAG